MAVCKNSNQISKTKNHIQQGNCMYAATIHLFTHAQNYRANKRYLCQTDAFAAKPITVPNTLWKTVQRKPIIEGLYNGVLAENAAATTNQITMKVMPIGIRAPHALFHFSKIGQCPNFLQETDVMLSLRQCLGNSRQSFMSILDS